MILFSQQLTDKNYYEYEGRAFTVTISSLTRTARRDEASSVLSSAVIALHNSLFSLLHHDEHIEYFYNENSR